MLIELVFKWLHFGCFSSITLYFPLFSTLLHALMGLKHAPRTFTNFPMLFPHSQTWWVSMQWTEKLVCVEDLPWLEPSRKSYRLDLMVLACSDIHLAYIYILIYVYINMKNKVWLLLPVMVNIYIHVYIHHKKRVWWHCCQLWAWQSCYNTRNKRYYLLTICFDYLWVVFFSSFQQEIQLRIRKHSNKYQLLNNTFSFCICMFQTENPDSYEKPQGWWCSQLQFFYYGVPTFSNLIAHLSVCSIIT